MFVIKIFVSPVFEIECLHSDDFLGWGLQKLSKNFPFAIKEIHKTSMLLTLPFGIPLRAIVNDFINMVMKDIHRFNTLFCR